MKRQGCSIIIVNDRNQVLLLLRDNISTIPCPDMWDIPGGHVEPGESPEQCIVREMKEEIDVDINGFQKFLVTEFSDRTEYTFWIRKNLHIKNITLTEGQYLKWFSEQEAVRTELAFGFNKIITEFYQKKPFLIK
jgi:8-oxo-dGTP diphosphatase